MTRQFSIFLPVHNGGTYVKECLAGILGQTYPHFTLEVLENQSDDGTAQWLSGLTDERVRVWSSTGLLDIEDNWARIGDLPKCEFMTFVGHDDILYPDFLETVNALVSRHPDASLYLTHFDIADASGTVARKCRAMPEVEKAHQFLSARLRWARDSFGTGYVMRSSDYLRVGGLPKHPGLLFSDDELWLRLMSLSHAVVSPRVCFAYQLHDASASGNPPNELLLEAFDEYLRFLRGRARDDADVERVLSEGLLSFVASLVARRSPKSERTRVAQYVARWFPQNGRAVLRAGKRQLFVHRVARYLPGPARKNIRWLRRQRRGEPADGA